MAEARGGARTCGGRGDRRWSVSLGGRSNGLAVDVTNRVTANGSKVRLWTALGNAHQQWSRA
ncbi:RICIN domain-containing protein [Streptomyces sp. NPDC014995]|uniref:RICIN domain-containing protein n=1 Tax=Streptomyces sp. NPDC014995 TaxID=3364936 RepID=UPI0036FA39E8